MGDISSFGTLSHALTRDSSRGEVLRLHREHIRKWTNGRIPERDPAVTYMGRVIIVRLSSFRVLLEEPYDSYPHSSS